MQEVLNWCVRQYQNFLSRISQFKAWQPASSVSIPSIQILDFQAIFAALPHNCLILDTQFNIVGVNDAYLKATNTDRRIIGQNIQTVFQAIPVDTHAKGDNNLTISLQRVLSSKKKEKMAIQRCDLPFSVGGEYEVRYWRPVITPVLNSKKEVLYIICQMEDVTLLMAAQNEMTAAENKERLLSSPQLRRATEDAQKANQSKGVDRDLLNKFMEYICHEVRNPLTIINGNAELLKEKLTEFLNLSENNNLTEEARSILENFQQLIRDILIAGNFQKDTVEKMLELSKLENNPDKLNKSRFNPKKLVQDFMKEFKQKVREKNLFLNLELPTENIEIMSDLSRLKYILRHLIENAIKFTSKGGVTIKLQYPKVEADDQVVMLNFTVKDTGSGMDDDEIKLLFNRYSQSFNSENSGFGLGMALCKQIVTSLGGKIIVKSKKGEGSQFQFTICAPAKALSSSLIAEEKTVEPESEQKLSLSFPKTSLSILVVEDNKMIQRLLIASLEQEGYKCEAASNGLEAINHFKEKQFDIIFMDMKMPVMDGIETTKEIRKIEKAKRLSPTVIIGISADNPESHSEDIKKIGLDYYFIKPYSPKKLIEKLDNIAYKKLLASSSASFSSIWKNVPIHTSTDSTNGQQLVAKFSASH